MADPTPLTDGSDRAITGDARPRANPRVAWVAVDDEVVLHDPSTRRVARLDRVAGLIWPFLDGTASIDELAADVADAFEQPLEEVSDALRRLVEDLAASRLITIGSDGQDREVPRPGYLVDPPGPCGGGGRRPEWAPTRTVAVDDVRVGVRTVPALDRVLEEALSDLLVDDDPGITPNYSLQPAAPDRRFHIVVRYLCDAVRTRDPHRAVQGLAAHLGGHRPEAPGLLRTACTAAVLADGRAVLLPNLVGVLGRVQRNLREAGANLVDLPWTDVDVTARELVVPDANPGIDPARLAALGDALTELSGEAPIPDPPVIPGRYPMAAWLLEAFLPQGGERLSRSEAVELAARLVPEPAAGSSQALRHTAELLAALPPVVVPWDDRRALVAAVRSLG